MALARPIRTLHRRLFRDDVVDYLIDCILKKRFVPGDRVLENQLADELAIGKGAVREALRDMVGMGFLSDEPYKGHRVRLCSVKEFHDYYQARMAMITMMTPYIFKDEGEHRTDTAGLRDLADEMKAAADHDDLLGYVKADLTFHRLIAEGTGNCYLVRAWEALDNYYWVTLHTHVGDFTTVFPADSHYPIVEAIEEGDAEKFVSLQIENLKSFLEFARPRLLEKGLLIDKGDQPASAL